MLSPGCGPKTYTSSAIISVAVWAGWLLACQLGLSKQSAELAPGAQKAFLDGTAAIQSGRYREAVDAFRKVVALDATFAPAYLNLGLAFHSLNDHEKAIASLKKALELDDRLESAALFLGIEYVQTDFPEKAKAPLQRALALKPGDPDVHSWLGKALLGLGQFKEAIPHLEKAAAAYPEDLEIQYTLARVHLLISQQMTEEIVEKAPHSYYTHYILGQSLKALGKIDLAITEFRLAIQGNPGLRGVHEALGNVYYEQPRYDRALEEYKEELSIDPYNSLVACKMYDILIRQGEADKAIGPLEKINQERPSLSCAHYELGKAWIQKRDYQKALKYLQATVAAMPDYAAAYDLLGQAYGRLGRTTEANEALAHGKALQTRSFPASEVLSAKDRPDR